VFSLWRTDAIHLVIERWAGSPLCRVWNEHRNAPWAQLLDYWGLPKLGVSAVTYAEPTDPVFGRRDRHRGPFGRKDIAMQSKRIALIVLPALLLGATTAAAQIPPPVPPLVPNPNPSSSLVLPAPHEVPVSPVTPGTLPGSTAPGVGDAAGIYATQPMGVFRHHHRRRHYSR